MKKHLLVVIAFISSLGAMAQNCTIDQQYANAAPGLYPAGPLGPTCELIAPKTIVSLTDTSVYNATLNSNVTLYITRMKILSITGLPSGLTVSTDVIGSADVNAPWGYWENTGSVPSQTSALGCAYVTGAQGSWNAAIGGGPMSDGEYPLVFEVDAYVASANPAFVGGFIGLPAWVSTIDPGVGGGSFLIYDTLLVASDYLNLDATISGASNIDPATQYNYSVTPVPGATYNWTVTNGTVMSGTGTASVMVEFSGSGSVEVDITDNSCSGNDVMVVTANAVGLDEVSGINASVYPNPSNGIFTLQLENSDALNIRIMDVSGKVVRAERLAGANLYTIDMTAVEAGVYVMEIESAEGRTFKRMVKN